MVESISLKSRLTGINWITGAPFTVSVILMEVFWVYPWLAWFSQFPAFRWSKTPLSLISFILILGISFVLSKQLINRDWSLGKVRLTIIGTGIFIILVILRFEFNAGTGLFSWEWFGHIGRLLLDSFSHFEPLILALVLSALLWWRGIRLGRSPLDADDIYRNFFIGVAALIVLILIAGASSWTNYKFDMSSTWLFLVGFFFFGLLAMALANLKSIQERISAESVSPAMHRRWLTVLLVVIGGMVTIGIAVASTLSTGFSYFLMGLLDKVTHFFTLMAHYIYIPFSYVIEWLYQMGLKIVSFFVGENPEPFEMNEIEDLIEPIENATGQGLPPEVILVLKWVFFALVIIGVIYIISKAILRFASYRGKEEIDEMHESLMSWDLFKSDLRLMLDKLWRLGRLSKAAKAALVLPAWYHDDYQNMLSIRQIYEALQWETARRNLGRHDYETPIEYARRLNMKVPEGSEIMDEITDLYVDARYGEHEIKTGILEYANFKWKVLRKLLRGPENLQAK